MREFERRATNRAGETLQEQPPPTERLSVLSRLARLLFGYDFFLSYAHKDGADYARKLEKSLSKKDFTVFRDETELPGGEPLTSLIRLSLRRTRRLVVVGTKFAVKSRWVEKEIKEFNEKKRRRIVLLDVHGIKNEQPWFNPDEFVFVQDSAGEEGPSENAIRNLVNGQSKWKVNQQARCVLCLVGVVIMALGVSTIIAVTGKHEAESVAEQQTELTQEATDLADIARTETEKAKREEEAAKAKENRERARKHLQSALKHYESGQSRAGFMDAWNAFRLNRHDDDRTIALSGQRLVNHYGRRHLARLWHASSRISQVYFSPTGDFALTFGPTDFSIWDAWTGQPIRLGIPIEEPAVTRVPRIVFSEVENRVCIVSGNVETTNDKNKETIRLTVLDLRTGRQMLEARATNEGLASILLDVAGDGLTGVFVKDAGAYLVRWDFGETPERRINLGAGNRLPIRISSSSSQNESQETYIGYRDGHMTIVSKGRCWRLRNGQPDDTPIAAGKI
jgi:hypothetical protein